MVKVKALKKFEWVVDTEVGRIRHCGEVFEVSEARAEVLLDAELVEKVKADVKVEPKIETATLEDKVVSMPKAKEVKPKKNKKK